ncbi:MAG: radical SAM protein, partial [Deltaproteobacteria bacterium]|nr:radical SAM protein [Deltaproteobacteria bacterium]
SVIDANLDFILRSIHMEMNTDDTWTRRAKKNLQANLDYLKHNQQWNRDRYIRAIMDINRLLEKSLQSEGIRVNLSNYQDENLSPVKSSDLLRAAETPKKSPFYNLFRDAFTPHDDGIIGISLNFLSQALPAFAITGYLKREYPGVKIIMGGGLVTSWIKGPGWNNPFKGLVDEMVAGPGEGYLQSLLHVKDCATHVRPRYDLFPVNEYLSPGFILPYSASSGCWWQKCQFCPERAEGNPYIPIPPDTVLDDLASLIEKHRPSMVHILDNAISPALLKRMIERPLSAPWYGFVRITDHFKDADYCMGLKRSGCAMLKIGIESGDQGVLDALDKGINLETASIALKNLRDAGINTYLYFLFGTPPEGEEEAKHTMEFVKRHHEYTGFMNLAIFNMPVNSPDAVIYGTGEFYEGDLSLYSSFKHPKGWDRGKVRAFLDNEFKKEPGIREIIKRNPPFFTSNHAAFFSR